MKKYKIQDAEGIACILLNGTKYTLEGLTDEDAAILYAAKCPYIAEVDKAEKPEPKQK
jgi:hypothetical protein